MSDKHEAVGFGVSFGWLSQIWWLSCEAGVNSSQYCATDCSLWPQTVVAGSSLTLSGKSLCFDSGRLDSWKINIGVVLGGLWIHQKIPL